MSGRILLVEDERTVAALVREALGDAGAELTHASTVAEGWRLFEELRPALAILDVGLPDGTGFELCRRIRAHPALAATPVVMLTGRSDYEDKASGFSAGADHYLIKPIQIAELRLWVGSLLRRVEVDDKEGGVLRAGEFAIDPAAHLVRVGDRAVRDLTRKEFEILYELVRCRPRVLSKDYLMKRLWSGVLRDNTIEVHVRNIRAKLGEGADRLQTVPGAGYRFD